MDINFRKLKPGLDKKWLYLIAGVFWIFAGGLLIRYAIGWQQAFTTGVYVLTFVIGILLALAIYQFGFSKFSEKNIQRIQEISCKRPCVFAFQQWSSYPLVLVMISLGIFLRKYSPLPKSMLAPVYLGIGGSLVLASSKYFFKIFSLFSKRRYFD